MRPVALGRRNWIHVGSKVAGPKVATYFRLSKLLGAWACRSTNTWVLRSPGSVNFRSIELLNLLTPYT